MILVIQKMIYIEIFLTLSNDITISIIPGQSYSEDIAHMAYKYGFEVMVHMPMEAFNLGHNNLDKYILIEGLSFQEVNNRLENAFIELPNALGINNHQGSKATENIQLMKHCVTFCELRLFNFQVLCDNANQKKTSFKRKSIYSC